MKLTLEPMAYHGPGWSIDAPSGTLYQLWAPNDRRRHWAAAWTANGGYDCGHRRADSYGKALSAFGTAADVAGDREAVAAAVALTKAAAAWERAQFCPGCGAHPEQDCQRDCPEAKGRFCDDCGAEPGEPCRPYCTAGPHETEEIQP